MPAGSNPQLTNAHEQDVNAASASPAWRSRTSRCRVRTWRRRCGPPRPSKRWYPLSALTKRGHLRCNRKRRYLGLGPEKSQKMYVYDKKTFSSLHRRGRREKRGIKNAGYSYDVIENKRRENVRRGYSYDVHENKRLISVYLRC